jgi:competence protein ComEA
VPHRATPAVTAGDAAAGRPDDPADPGPAAPATPQEPLDLSPFAARPPDEPPWRRLVAPLVGRLGATPSALAGGAVANAVVVVVLVVTVRATSGSSPRPELSLPLAAGAAGRGGPRAGGAGGAPGAPAAPTAGEPVVVHVAGAVAHPGLQRLQDGARVGDALTAAGGPAPDADTDAVNLAAKVADGDRVYVPRRGEAPPPAAAGPTAPAILDINAATAEQLDALPGVGPSLAAAIVEYRRQHGRFRSVPELLEVPGIGDAKLGAIRPKVRV